MPTLLSAPSKKSFSSVNSPIFAWCGGTSLGFSPEYPGRPSQKLRLPLRDLIGVNVELLRQLGQRLLALQSSQCHFRLECRAVVPARSFRHRLSPDPQPSWPLSGRNSTHRPVQIRRASSHHCYREKPDADDSEDLKGDDKKEAEKNN